MKYNEVVEWLSVPEYAEKFATDQRNSRQLLKSLLLFAKWLYNSHLQGYVCASFQALRVDENHNLHFEKVPLVRPETHFPQLSKLEEAAISFKQTGLSNGFFKSFTKTTALVVSNNGEAPELAINHFDANTDSYRLGIVVTRLFSNCNPFDIDELKELITSPSPGFNWYHQQLYLLAKACLQPQPSGRLLLREAIQIMEKLIYELEGEQALGANDYVSILNRFKSTLLDFSARNVLFNFREQAATLTLDFTANEVLAGKVGFVFKPGESDSKLNKLHTIRRRRQQLLREKGEDGLLLISHFLHWQLGSEQLQSPLLTLPAALQYQNDFQVQYRIKSEAQYFVVNEVLRIFFRERFNFQLPHSVPLIEADAFLEKLTNDLIARGATVQRVQEQVVLGVFSYHNVAIAGDYNHMLQVKPNALNLQLLGFEKLTEKVEPNDKCEWPAHLVLPADPSQAAVLRNAKVQSLVVEGPPGTGKSQTIANMLAQAVAQGQKVLFVSEKRAALDVVYNRLSKASLGHLALCVHNAQNEKKEIIESVANSLQYLSQALQRDAELGVKLATWRLEEAFEAIDRYHKIVRSRENGFSLNELFLRNSSNKLSFDEDWVPDLNDWLAQQDLILELVNLLKKSGLSEVWNQNHCARLNHRALAQSHAPAQLLAESIEKASAAIELLKPLFAKHSIEISLGDALQIRSLAKSLKWLIDRNLVKLVLDDNPLKERFEKLRQQYFAKQALIEKRRQKASGLSDLKVGRRELESALNLAENQPDNEELKLFVSHLTHDGQWFAHDVKNLLRNALLELQNEEQLLDIEAKFQSLFKTANPGDFINQVALLQDLSHRMQYHLVSFFKYLNQKKFPDAVLQEFLQFDSAFQQLEDAAFVLHNGFRNLQLSELKQYIKELKSKPFTAEIQQALYIFNGLKPNLKHCIDKTELTIPELESAAVQREIDRAFLAYPDLETFTYHKIDALQNQLNEAYNEWLQWNAWYINDVQAKAYQRKMSLSETPAVKLSHTEKQEKWAFKKGMRMVRNEIDKTRFHKSLRELLHADAAHALNLLKPIYLMSPVAVAESFPCQFALFDLVVFDEASQLRLEDVLPVVHRAKRVVVVGDSMQLPPANFFRSKIKEAKTHDNLSFASFLNAAKAAFHSAALSWHYRSQSQELIQFSNQHFYEGKLKVFPSFKATKPAIVLRQLKGCYQNRQNIPEAEAVVQYFAQLLKNQREKTYAIIALSENQQQAIETAIDSLRAADAVFNQLMNREDERLEDGAFAGSLVKNLENMQGEERDVVLISLGYGPDERGHFRQHFGPVMHEGGERRLNVLFSRAKHQMVLFSSFDTSMISATENVGLWTLQKFLEYADSNKQDVVTEQVGALTKQPEVLKCAVEKYKAKLPPNVRLQAVSIFAQAAHSYFQVYENELPTQNILVFENENIETWNEFFVAQRILNERGFGVQSVSTQEVAKS